MCKCPKGRNFQVDTENHEHSLVFCEYCGSLAVHLDCLDDDEFRCDDCEKVIIRTQAQTALSNLTNSQAVGAACSSSGSGRSTNINEKYQLMAKELNIRDFDIHLLRLNADDFKSTSKINYHKFLTMRKKITTIDQNIVKKDRSSDENEIQPMLRKTGKINAYFLPVSDSESDIEIAPVNIHQTPKKNVFNDSDSDHGSNETNNAYGMNNLNTQDTKLESNSKRFNERRMSNGEDESAKPSVIIRNHFRIDNSDDAVEGKENEKPHKSVAVVRPFSLPNTTSDQNVNIKTEKYPCDAFYVSSGGTSDESTYKSAITQRYDYLKNVSKKDERAVSVQSSSNVNHATSSGAIKHTPNKRKHRTVRSFFCDISSSDEEITEPKPKRKSPKQVKRNSPAHANVPSNQSTIINFFQRKLNQGTSN